ncbi:ECF RNA polymerase sigma factor SigE [Aquisphaera giovannonii]|uniref:ECF RNA polymerase sigma factor SigE n=1 Tax=Aquisphaera giovannonii TaxID=406548 RepID=A0A5B9WBJ1_9BACT|nr:sigma-70 family RNA polymerase sigma factor [Aquisphaera giovannonii]QEH38048.1 ECF RNA polymerase sigma factor SigE [Aquisphaera giovannonii]
MKATTESTGALARGLEAVFRGAAGSSEGDLLRRFVASGDEEAFAAIVRRHGPMVLGVCRRILGGGADADDAFQATFLVLLRRARSLQGTDVLGPWLHGVAWRVAARARAGNARRRAEESKAARDEAAGSPPVSPAEAAEVQAILDEEIGRLPEKYRVPVVLCCLEGMSREAAAEHLRWRPGVLRGRLQRGRDRLRDRLVHRGLAPAVAATAVEVIGSPAEAAVSCELLAATVAAVSRDLAVGAVASAVAPTAAATLAGAFLRGQTVARAAVAACVLVAAGLAVASFSALVMAAGPRADEVTSGAEPLPQDAPAEKPRTFEVRVVGPGGKAIPEATVEFQTTPSLGEELVRRGTFVPRNGYGTEMKADGDGVVLVELPRGLKGLEVFVKKRGYGRYFAGWSAEEHQVAIPDRLTADLDPASPLGGVVVDPEGRPVEGAVVRCNLNYKGGPDLARRLGYQQTTRTDREGRWRVDDVPDSVADLSVDVNHPGFRPLLRLIPRGEFGLAGGREPSARLALDRGLTITGRIKDEAGRPIAGAIVRTKFVNDRREARTANDGSYRLEGCEPRMARVVVLARGHATDMKEVRVATNMGPVDFTLRPAVGLKLKILDAAGKPIPRTRIFFQRWRGAYQYFEFDGVNQYADASGEWRWDEAPLDEFAADICPPDGTQLPEQPIPARDAAKVVTFRLPPTLVLTGRVVDAETKQPIRSFRVVPGGRWEANNQLSWSEGEAFPASDGRFEYRPSRPESVTLVRVEADGYASVVSRDVRREEGSVTLRFELSRARGLVGKVLTPKNQAAAGARIAVGVEGSQISIRNGAFDEQSTYCKRASADDVGRFSLPAQAGDFQLIILHPEGFACINSPATWETVRLIRLEPWARLEGTFRIGPRPAPGVPLDLYVPPVRLAGAIKGAPNVFWRHQAVTGPDGRFAFDHALPGRGTVGREITLMADDGAAEATSSCKVGVDLPGGKTTHVDLGGTGRAIVGRLELTAGPGEKPPWNFAEVASTPVPEARADLPSLMATVAMDGRFRIDDVPPGRYRLVARFGPYEAVRRRGLQGLSCARTIDVPAPDGRPVNEVDLGVMKMEKR